MTLYDHPAMFVHVRLAFQVVSPTDDLFIIQKGMCRPRPGRRIPDKEPAVLLQAGKGEEFFTMRLVLRSKIHNAVVTEADLEYVGSITIDLDLIEKAGLWVNEKVLIVSITSGARIKTYVMAGERGSGTICVNGAAAHLIKAGERIIVMGFEMTDKPVDPRIILVDDQNRFVRFLQAGVWREADCEG